MKLPGNIYLCIVAALAAAGCSINHSNPAVIRESICFNVAVNPNTRATVSSGSTYPDDQPFALWAFYDSGDAFLDNVASELNGDGRWQPRGGMLWPEGNSALTFYASSPYGRGSFEGERGLVFENYDISEGLDLLYTYPVDSRDQVSSNGVVSLDFRHALATLRFSAITQLGEGSVITIKRISIDGIATRASFSSLPYAKWVCSGEVGSLVIFEGAADVGDSRIVLDEGTYQIPQKRTVTVRVLFDYSDGSTLLPAQEIESELYLNLDSGKIVQYLLTINSAFTLKIEKDNA